MGFKEGVFSGLFWGRIDTPDTAGLAHAIYLSLQLRGEQADRIGLGRIHRRPANVLPSSLDGSRK